MKLIGIAWAALWTIFLINAATALPDTSTADPTTALMDTIESQVKLPPGASALSNYVRTYAYFEDGTVIGIYVSEDSYNAMHVAQKPGRTWVKAKELPRIFGGGCTVVTVFFDPKTQSVNDVRCNFDE